MYMDIGTVPTLRDLGLASDVVKSFRVVSGNFLFKALLKFHMFNKAFFGHKS